MGVPRRGLWGRIVDSLFPERQILVRDQGRIRTFTLSTAQQLLIVGVIAGCALWALLASAAYLDSVAQVASKDDEIAHRAAELDGVKANYQAAFNQLDEFQTIFSGITCEITDIQSSLLKIAEHNIITAKRSGAGQATPRLNPDANGCRGDANKTVGAAGAAPNAPASDTHKIVGALKDDAQHEQLKQRIDRLEEELARLKASHGAFLGQTADLAANRIGQLERALASAGVDPKLLGSARHDQKTDGMKGGPFGQGGPFIAAKPGVVRPQGEAFNPVALFNTHADRLDDLTTAIRSLPFGEPLNEYEITSPFGTRNDPINALTGIHEGVDMGAPAGTPVLATGEGQVAWASWRDRYGFLVEVDHGMGVRTRYAHLSKVLVSPGQHVSRGTPLGLVGMTGRTTGPHLHYEVRVSDQPTNPMKFIMAGQNVLQGQ